MKSTKIKTKTEKGITLIALIITIVVLLILAVVAINSITNDGIISKTEQAANKYNESVNNEANQLQNYLDYLNEHSGNPKTYAAYTVGQEVRLTEAQRTKTGETGTFYVVKDSGTTESKVTLVTKFCIDTDNLVQSSTPNTITFSKENDWYTPEKNFFYLYGTEEPSSDHYAAHKAWEYGKKIGGFGRLPAYQEIKSDWFSNDFSFWLGHVYSNEPSLGLEETSIAIFDISSNYIVDSNMADHSSVSYVLPVVEISKSLIESVTAE